MAWYQDFDLGTIDDVAEEVADTMIREGRWSIFYTCLDLYGAILHTYDVRELEQAIVENELLAICEECHEEYADPDDPICITCWLELGKTTKTTIGNSTDQCHSLIRDYLELSSAEFVARHGRVLWSTARLVEAWRDEAEEDRRREPADQDALGPAALSRLRSQADG